MHDRDLAATREAVVTVVEPAALEERIPFADLVQRAARRRRRRWQVAAGVVVCLVAAGLLGKPAADRMTTPPAATPTASPTRPPVLSNTLQIQSVMFSTPESGYVVAVRCAGAGYRCAAHATLLRTTDGARTWTAVPNPTDYASGDQVRIETVTATGVALSEGERRYVSTDSGQSWHIGEFALHPGPPVGAVPAGWDIVAAEGKVAALDPIRNQYRPLTHQPSIADTPNLWIMRSGPTHRLLAVSDPGGQLGMAYSDDAGRSWHDLAAPNHFGVPYRQVLTADATDRVYLVEGNNEFRAVAVYRLDHIGGSWNPVPVPRRVLEEPNGGSVKVVQELPNGELVYGLDPPVFTRNGGTQVQVVPPVMVYGSRAAMAYPNPVVAGHTMISTLPPGVDAPPLTIALLFSTDSGRNWDLHAYTLPS